MRGQNILVIPVNISFHVLDILRFEKKLVWVKCVGDARWVVEAHVLIVTLGTIRPRITELVFCIAKPTSLTVWTYLGKSPRNARNPLSAE